jgi:hypothetical protein
MDGVQTIDATVVGVPTTDATVDGVPVITEPSTQPLPTTFTGVLAPQAQSSNKDDFTAIGEFIVEKIAASGIIEVEKCPRINYVVGDTVNLPGEIDDGRIKQLFSQYVAFKYDESINKFRLDFNERQFSNIVLSPQIAYIMGFEDGTITKSGQTAKYSFNLQGGLNSFCVYAKGLTENIIMGNELVSLLRVVAVSGKHGDTIEKIYDAPIYSRVLPRQINEIEIEMRTLEGELMPFQFGVTIVTLVFKKVIVF